MNARTEQGKLVGGVWLPKSETHLEEMMIKNPKGNKIVDGLATYQHHKLMAALAICKPPRTLALDIGGHCGLWSMWLVKHFKYVHAFEPVPLHRELFIRNVWPQLGMSKEHAIPAGAALAPHQTVRYPTDGTPASAPCVLHGIALGEVEGVCTMQIPIETTGNAHVAIEGEHPGTRGVAHPERAYEIANVPMRRIDSMGFSGVDFIKIDVEGFERAVIAGAEKTIRRDKPIIVVEQKGNDRAYNDEPNAAVKLLQKWGAKIDKNISGDYIMRWDGCGCGDRRESVKRVLGLAP